MRATAGRTRCLTRIGLAWMLCVLGTSVPGHRDVVDAVGADSVVSVTPRRLLETRIGAGLTTYDGRFEGEGPIPAGGTIELDVAGRGGVPDDARAVIINLTAVSPAAPGFMTAWACGQERPDPASNVNYLAGDVSPNAVLAEIGVGGRVCIYSLATTDALVDVSGYVPAGGTLVPVRPARLLETRDDPGLRTVDAVGAGGGAVAARTVVEVEVAGRGGVPDDASAVLLNVTAVFPEGPGYLNVYPCGGQPPDPASTVNYSPGGVYPNAVLAKIGDGGKVCVFSLARSHVLVDVNGYAEFGSSLVASRPLRMLETRIGDREVTFDRDDEGGGRVGAGEVFELQVAGRGSVPDGATAVMMNLTAVNPSAPGFLTAYPCDEPRPDPASNVNYSAGGAYPNAVFARLSASGAVCIFTLAETDLIADVVGSVGAGGTGVDLSEISLRSSRAQPFDRIAVDGLDLTADLASLTVRLDVDGVTYGNLRVWKDTDGPYVTAPFNPIDAWKTGDVQLVVADGDRLGRAKIVRIDPLPEARGAWAAIVDQLKTVLAGRAAAAGSSMAAVRSARFDELPPRLGLIKLLDGWLDDGTDTDIESMFAGSDPLTDEQRSLVESIAAKLEVGSMAAGQAVGAAPATVPSALASKTSLISPAAASEASTAGGGCQRPADIADADELMKAMERGVESKGDVVGTQQQVLDAIKNLLDIVQYVPGVVGEVADVVGAILSVSWALSLIEYYESPTELIGLDVTGTRSFNEDFENPGELFAVVVTARNTGGSIVDAINEVAATVAGFVAGNLAGEALPKDAAVEFIARFEVNLAKIAIADTLNDHLPDTEPVCQRTWRVNINSPELVDVTASRGGLTVDVTGPYVEFEPTRIGDAQLRVTARSGKFAGRSATGFLPVTTKAIQVVLTSDPTVIAGPTSSFTVSAQVLNADDPTLEWTTPNGTFTTTGANEQPVINYPVGNVPTFPHVVSARSMSTSGLRKPDAVPRTGAVTVRVQAISIVPSTRQLRPGESVEFMARDAATQTLDDSLVEWDADGGTIGDDGVYVAGSTPGTYAITAVLKSDPSKVAVASVTITPDDCYFGTWELQAQRYLDDLYEWGLAEYGEAYQSYVVSGVERVTFTPRGTGPTDFYPRYLFESTIATQQPIDGTVYGGERRGSEGGEFDPDATIIQLIPDSGEFETRQIIDGEVGPWQPGGGPLAHGSDFQLPYTCGDVDLTLGGDTSSPPIAAYYTRVSG